VSTDANAAMRLAVAVERLAVALELIALCYADGPAMMP
jgi:hypothetical protein